MKLTVISQWEFCCNIDHDFSEHEQMLPVKCEHQVVNPTILINQRRRGSWNNREFIRFVSRIQWLQTMVVCMCLFGQKMPGKICFDFCQISFRKFVLESVMNKYSTWNHLIQYLYKYIKLWNSLQSVILLQFFSYALSTLYITIKLTNTISMLEYTNQMLLRHKQTHKT